MASELEKLSHSAQRKAVSVMLDTLLIGLAKDREKTFLKMLDMARFFYGIPSFVK